MTNRDGADIQEARKYVTSKQGNMTNAANSANNNSSNSQFSSSINAGANNKFSNSVDAGLNSLSSSSVSNSKPMAATINEAKQLNNNQGSGGLK